MWESCRNICRTDPREIGTAWPARSGVAGFVHLSFPYICGDLAVGIRVADGADPRMQRTLEAGYWIKDYPLLAREWHPTRNGVVHPGEVTYGSGVRFWWRCSADLTHEWRATPNGRTAGKSGCPFCAGRKPSATNNLGAVAPHLAAEWHAVKNGTRRPEQVVAGTTRPVWWQCPRGDDHEWLASPHDRLQSKGNCPFCLGRRVSRQNCLAACAPELAREWHPTKNGERTPADTVVGSSGSVWWQCTRGHDWRATVDNRYRAGSGCPVCARSGTRAATKGPRPPQEHTEGTASRSMGYHSTPPAPCASSPTPV
jgi:hypothetical protein